MNELRHLLCSKHCLFLGVVLLLFPFLHVDAQEVIETSNTSNIPITDLPGLPAIDRKSVV